MVEPLRLESTAKTPEISFNNLTGLLNISGKSIPENTISFYRPVFEWIDKYVQDPAVNTNLNVQLDYFNTSTSKILLDIFKKIELIIECNKGEALVVWNYDEYDDDMFEAGEDFQSHLKLPFHFIPFKKE